MQTRKSEEEAFDDQRFIPSGRFSSDEEDGWCDSVSSYDSRAGSYSNGSILVTDGGRLSVMTGIY